MATATQNHAFLPIGFSKLGETSIPGASNREQATSRTWLSLGISILVVEKIIQHLFVTWAFYVDFDAIRASVVVSPDALMVAGAFVAVLFALAFWARLRQALWATRLIFALALFDFIGEFVAQGRIAIKINVSVLVASALMVLTLMELRTQRRVTPGAPVK